VDAERRAMKLNCNQMDKMGDCPLFPGSTWHCTNGVWKRRPDSWCTEFTNLAIKKNTLFDPDTHNDNEQYNYFIKRRRFIGPIKTSYKDLGSLLYHGYYIALNQGIHSGLFISWERPYRPVHDYNTFHAICGNGGGRVKLDIYKVGKPFVEGKTIVSWEKDLYPYYGDKSKMMTDGFGNTRKIGLQQQKG
jgi:hypothetical protein